MVGGLSFWDLLSMGVVGGILYHGFTAFFLPLKRDLGVDSAIVSLLFGAARLEGGFEGPIVSHLIKISSVSES
jgi:hypothetical protein